MRQILGAAMALLLIAGCGVAAPSSASTPVSAPSSAPVSVSTSLPTVSLSQASDGHSTTNLPQQPSAEAVDSAAERTSLASSRSSSTTASPSTATPTDDATTRSSKSTTSDAPQLAGGTTAQIGGVLASLDTLAVKGRAPKTGYERTVVFGPAWTDSVSVNAGHNGCDTRNDILRRDLTNLTVKVKSHGCTVLAGTLHDPYTGKRIDFTRGRSTSGAVQIDHVVALMDAWQKGAQGRSQNERANLANDPLNLLAVDGPSNAQKGAGDAATWLPKNKSFRCDYVARQVQVKAKYRLWVTKAEKDAIQRVLGKCSGPVTLPVDVPNLGVSADGAVPVTTTYIPEPDSPATLSVRTAPQAPRAPQPGLPRSASSTPEAATMESPNTGDCYPLSANGNCYRPGQMCAKKHHDGQGIDAFGAAIECMSDGTAWRWKRP